MPKTLVLLALVLASCSRSGLEFQELYWDASLPIVPADAGPDASCIPELETCNALDDDCDGQVDEGIVPEPCPTGDGLRVCIRGEWSACWCDCVPGATRQCFGTYCTGWGVQHCNGEGEWTECREADAMDGCQMGYSPDPASERCCIEHGGCCADEFDLDGDGDVTESLGTCGGVTCG